MAAVEMETNGAVVIENGAVEIIPGEMVPSTAAVVVDNNEEDGVTSTNHSESSSCCSRKVWKKIYIILCNFFLPFFVIATVGFISYITDVHGHRLAFVFPSLGATAFLHFAVPDKPAASPRNTLIGHFIGVLAGSVSLQVTFLYDNQVVLVEGVNVERIFCAALSVAITACLMVLFDAPHPPSCATTLIVSLGILKTPKELGVVMAAVLLLTLEAFVLNKLFRRDVVYPVWRANVTAERSMSKKIVLENEMKNLTMENFLDCFQACLETKNDQIMLKLIQFATQHRDTLSSLDNYSKIVPYATRIAIENCLMTNTSSRKVTITTSGM